MAALALGSCTGVTAGSKKGRTKIPRTGLFRADPNCLLQSLQAGRSIARSGYRLGLDKSNELVSRRCYATVDCLIVDDCDSRSSLNACDVQAPLLHALKECASNDTAAFHFPGHRRGAAAPPLLADLVGVPVFAHDLPELPELDNLFAPQGVIREAQMKAAVLFGADATFFLVNGSTCGIQAAVMATCLPGDYLILPRNCHSSAVSAMVLSGALPAYVTPTFDSTWGVAHGVSPVSVKSAFSEVERAGGRVGAVLIVSPTYFGVCSIIREIADICHDKRIPLIVDEAHGAHFRFHRDFPETALEQGADISIQSTHKVLGSLTQSSMLHVKGTRVNKDLLSRALQILQTSSPSYLLLSSLDAARAHMTDADCSTSSFNPVMQTALELACLARKRLKATRGLFVLDSHTMQQSATFPAAIDPLRITVGLWELEITGFEADDILRAEYGVIAELPSLFTLTFAVSAGTSVTDVNRLIDAFSAISIRFRKVKGVPESVVSPLNGLKSTIIYQPSVMASSQQLPASAGRGNVQVLYRVQTADADAIGCLCSSLTSVESAMLVRSEEPKQMHQVAIRYTNMFPENYDVGLSPREAFFSKTLRVDIADAAGQICAELLCPYPPGIPVITPGEVILKSSLEYLQSIIERGGTVSGASDPSLSSICICQR